VSKFVRGILLFSLACVPAFADLFQGTFGADDQVALFNITASTPEIITIQTYSYGGGTVGSTIIPAGGFAPAAFLFGAPGSLPFSPLPLSAGNSSQVMQDPTTLNYDDLYFQDTLGPGAYTLALVVDDNTPAGFLVGDGFVEDGNPGFTCQVAGVSGNFCDLTTAFGTSRSGNYAISISGATSVVQVTVPEPSFMFLLLAGCALTVLLKRRSNLKAV
jgi:hypothetical protein